VVRVHHWLKRKVRGKRQPVIRGQKLYNNNNNVYRMHCVLDKLFSQRLWCLACLLFIHNFAPVIQKSGQYKLNISNSLIYLPYLSYYPDGRHIGNTSPFLHIFGWNPSQRTGYSEIFLSSMISPQFRCRCHHVSGVRHGVLSVGYPELHLDSSRSAPDRGRTISVCTLRHFSP
jgi:hypothetical protein